jgi:hypothetical protein
MASRGSFPLTWTEKERGDHDTQFLHKIHSSSLSKLPISSALIVLIVCLKEIMREELKNYRYNK